MGGLVGGRLALFLFVAFISLGGMYLLFWENNVFLRLSSSLLDRHINCSVPTIAPTTPPRSVRDFRTCYNPLHFREYVAEFLRVTKDHHWDRLPQLVEVTRDPRVIVMYDSYQYAYQKQAPMEIAAVAILRSLLPARCKKQNNNMKTSSSSSYSGALVLDMGANDGFYAMLASSYGCRVISFEPQPGCVRPLIAAIGINKISPPIDLRQRIVTSDRNVRIKVPDLQCSGVAHYGGGKYGEADEKDEGKKIGEKKVGEGEEVEIGSQVLDDVVCEGDELLLWHVDVEGFETVVLDSGASIVKQRKAKNMILEWNPSRNRWNNISATEWKRWGEIITNAGYTCYDMDRGAPDGILLKDTAWITKDHDVFCTIEHTEEKLALSNLK